MSWLYRFYHSTGELLTLTNDKMKPVDYSCTKKTEEVYDFQVSINNTIITKRLDV